MFHSTSKNNDYDYKKKQENLNVNKNRITAYDHILPDNNPAQRVAELNEKEEVQKKEAKENPITKYRGKVITFYSTYYSDKISALDLTTNEGLEEMIRLAEKANITPLTNEQAEFLNSKQQHETPPQKAASIYSVSGMTGTIVKGYTNTGQVVELYNTSKHNQKHITPYDEPKWYEYNGLEGSWDGANYSNITPKDVTVGLGIVGTLTGIGALVELGTVSVISVIAILNSLDDALGGFINEEGGMSNKLVPDEQKKLLSAVKTVIAFLSSKPNLKQVNGYENVMNTLSKIIDGLSGLFSMDSILVKDEVDDSEK